MSPNCIVGLIPHLTHTEEEPNALSPEEVHSFLAAIRDRYPQHLRWHADRLPAGPMRESELLFPSETGGFRSAMVLDKPFKDVCKHLKLGEEGAPEGDAPDVSGSRPQGRGEQPGPTQHLRAPD